MKNRIVLSVKGLFFGVNVIVPLRSKEEKDIFNADESAETCSMVCEFACVVGESLIFCFATESFEDAFVLLIIATPNDKPTSIYARDEAGFGVKVFADVCINRIQREYICSAVELDEDQVVCGAFRHVETARLPFPCVFEIEIHICWQSDTRVESTGSVVLAAALFIHA